MNIVERSVIQYCERGVQNNIEPINAISSLIFLIVAYFVFSLVKKHNLQNLGYKVIIILLASIGVGSTLWHIFRTQITLALDAIPIYIFFLSFLYLLFKKLTGNKQKSLLLLVGYFLLQITMTFLFPELLQGSVRHVVNIFVFIFITYWIKRKYNIVSREVIGALVFYTLAVVFRILDDSICPYFSIGTHFLWHMLTATAAYYAVKALVLLDLKNNSSSARD